MQKETLKNVIKFMLLILIMGFLYVLISSTGGPRKQIDVDMEFADIAMGQTAVRRVAGKKVWVTRLSSMQKNQIHSLNSHMLDADAGCPLAVNVCVLLAATERSGIDIVFTADEPAQLPATVPWFGGFVDPTSGEVFDLMGRAYKHTSKVTKARTALSTISTL